MSEEATSAGQPNCSSSSPDSDSIACTKPDMDRFAIVTRTGEGQRLPFESGSKAIADRRLKGLAAERKKKGRSIVATPGDQFAAGIDYRE